MSNTALTFAPSFFALNTSQGSSVELTIFVKNPSEEEIFFRVEMKDILISSLKERSLSILENPLLTSPSQWGELSSQTFSVKPNVTGEFKFKLNIPDNAAVQEYYPAILFKRVTDRSDDQVYLSTDFIAPIYINIAKDGQNDYSSVVIKEFNAKNNIVFYPWNEFNITVQNGSNNFVYPRGRVKIFDATGRQLTDTPTINDKYEAILRNEVLDLSLPWSDKNGFRLIPPIGEYKAVIDVYLDAEIDNPLHAETTFTVIPLGYFAFYAVLLLLLVSTYRIFKRKFKIR